MNSSAVENYYGLDPNTLAYIVNFYDEHLTERGYSDTQAKELCKALSGQYFKEWLEWESFRAIMYSYFFETVVANSEECF